MKKLKSSLLTMAMFCFFIALPIAISEVICATFIGNQQPVMPNIRGGYNYLDVHPILGRHLRPGGVYKSTFYVEEENTFINASYTLDEYRRRVTPLHNDDDALRDKFLAFFGCSFVFGWAVNDDETLPFQIGKLTKEYRPYNYGFPGGATQHMYHRLLASDMSTEINEKKGVLLYLFVPFQINRIIGGMPEFNLWTDEYPCYRNENGSFRYKGSFRQAYPWRATLYDVLYKSNTLRAMNFNLPLHHNDKHFDIVLSYFVESKKLFMKRFPDSDFVVVLFGDASKVQPIQSRLNRCGIDNIVLDEVISFDLVRNKRFPDGHPKPEWHELIANTIVHELKLQ